jgi:hypothetical protein
MRFRGDMGGGRLFLLALGLFFNSQILESHRLIGNAYKRNRIIRLTFGKRSIAC